jgi:hypothetical protein
VSVLKVLTYGIDNVTTDVIQLLHFIETQAECKYKFVHIELVHVNGWAHVFLNLNKNNKQSLKIYPGTQRKNWKC